MAGRNEAMMNVMNYMHELTNMMISANDSVVKQKAEMARIPNITSRWVDGVG